MRVIAVSLASPPGKTGVGLPRPAGRAVYIQDSHNPHAVEVRVAMEPEGPIVTEVRVLDPDGVSPRNVKRLPLSTYVDAAIAAVSSDDPGTAGDVLTAPRGRPRKGYSTDFYREFATYYRKLLADGVRHPAQEIAKRKKGVDANTVHQWVFRARQLGFLEQPRRRRKGTT